MAAVCERAKVAPRAIYDRTTSKEALFLAVYEHGLSRIRVHEEVLDRDTPAQTPVPTPAQMADRFTAVVLGAASARFSPRS
ncbi:hypothetical protein ACFU6M_22890 [Streptomyces bottropensis]